MDDERRDDCCAQKEHKRIPIWQSDERGHRGGKLGISRTQNTHHVQKKCDDQNDGEMRPSPKVFGEGQGDQTNDSKTPNVAITALLGIFIEDMSLHDTQIAIGITNGKNHAAVVQVVTMSGPSC